MSSSRERLVDRLDEIREELRKVIQELQRIEARGDLVDPLYIATQLELIIDESF